MEINQPTNMSGGIRSERGLKMPVGGSWSGTLSGFSLGQKMGEHDLVGKKGNPFMGGGAVGARAADELVLTVGQFDEVRPAKAADVLLTEPLWDKVFKFHTPSLYAGGSDNCGVRWLSVGSK